MKCYEKLWDECGKVFRQTIKADFERGIPTMRLAVISDIHGECFTLDQVLQDIRRQDIEQIVCLGDALQGGSQPAETLARLRELNCPVVMGNADAWLITGQNTSPDEEISEKQ